MGQLVSFHTRQPHYSSGSSLCLNHRIRGRKQKPPQTLYWIWIVFCFFFVLHSDCGAPVSAGRGCASAGPSRSPGREVRCQPGPREPRLLGAGPVCSRPSPPAARLGTPRPEGWLLTHPSRCLRKHGGDAQVPASCPRTSARSPGTPFAMERMELPGAWRCSSAPFLCA